MQDERARVGGGGAVIAAPIRLPAPGRAGCRAESRRAVAGARWRGSRWRSEEGGGILAGGRRAAGGLSDRVPAAARLDMRGVDSPRAQAQPVQRRVGVGRAPPAPRPAARRLRRVHRLLAVERRRRRAAASPSDAAAAEALALRQQPRQQVEPAGQRAPCLLPSRFPRRRIRPRPSRGCATRPACCAPRAGGRGMRRRPAVAALRPPARRSPARPPRRLARRHVPPVRPTPASCPNERKRRAISASALRDRAVHHALRPQSSSRASSGRSSPTAAPTASAAARTAPSHGCASSPAAGATCCAATSASTSPSIDHAPPARRPARAGTRGRPAAADRAPSLAGGGGELQDEYAHGPVPPRRPARGVPAARAADRQPRVAVPVELLPPSVRPVSSKREAGLRGLPALRRRLRAVFATASGDARAWKPAVAAAAGAAAAGGARAQLRRSAPHAPAARPGSASWSTRTTSPCKARKVRHATRRLGERHDAWRAGRLSFAEFDASVQGWINPVRIADAWGLRGHVLAPFVLEPGCRLRPARPKRARCRSEKKVFGAAARRTVTSGPACPVSSAPALSYSMEDSTTDAKADEVYADG